MCIKTFKIVIFGGLRTIELQGTDHYRFIPELDKEWIHLPGIDKILVEEGTEVVPDATDNQAKAYGEGVIPSTKYLKQFKDY